MTLNKLSVSALPPLSECLAGLSELRLFGVALARDDRFVVDHASAATLVDRLFRQASLEAVGEGVRGNAGRQLTVTRAFAPLPN